MDPVELFVRGVWQYIPSEDDISWVQRAAELEGTSRPLGDYGPIVKEMLDKGISPYTVARFAKIVGYETAFGLCYHLDDPNASYEGFPDEEDDIKWALFQTNPTTDAPIEALFGMHELLLSMDPSDRECGQRMHNNRIEFAASRLGPRCRSAAHAGR